MISREDLEELRNDMLMEARENERRECMMRDFDCFCESDVALEYYEALEALQKACEEYGHDVSDII